MPFFKLGIQITVIPAQCKNVRNGYWLVIIPSVPRVSLLVTQDRTQIALHGSFPYRSTPSPSKNIRAAPQTSPAQLSARFVWKEWCWQHKTASKPSCIWTQVLLWSAGRNWTLARKNPLWQPRLSSLSLSSCFMLLFCLENRSHLRKETCDTSENLASTDRGSKVSTWCLCLELDWKTSWAEKLSQRPGLKANTGTH